MVYPLEDLLAVIEAEEAAKKPLRRRLRAIEGGKPQPPKEESSPPEPD